MNPLHKLFSELHRMLDAPRPMLNKAAEFAEKIGKHPEAASCKAEVQAVLLAIHAPAPELSNIKAAAKKLEQAASNRAAAPRPTDVQPAPARPAAEAKD